MIGDMKVWPLDEDGSPVMERPSYHRFSTLGVGTWSIARWDDGRWVARLTPEQPPQTDST